MLSPFWILLAKNYPGHPFSPRSIREPANSSKKHLVTTSSNEVNIAPKIVGYGSQDTAKGSGMSGGKRSASLSPPKPRISSNLDGRQSGPGHAVQIEPDVVAGATSASDKPPATGKRTRSRVKAANKASGAKNVPDGVSGCRGKTPTSPAAQSATSGSPVRTCS